jgi:hypothetical protein
MIDRVSLRAGRDFNMPGIRRALVLLVFAGGFSLAGCGDPPPEAPAGPATSSAKAPKLAGLSTDMVAAVPAGRSSTAITVHFALGKPPVMGQAFPVEIAIVPHQDFASVRASFDGVDGLAVTVGSTMEPVTSVKLESILEHQLVLLPAREGVYVITATVETDSPEGTVSRVFSLPVIVAATETPETAPAAAAPAGAARQ